MRETGVFAGCPQPHSEASITTFQNDWNPLTMLEKISIFAGLGEREIAALEAIAVRKEISKNTIVIHEGEKSDSLYILISGKADAVSNNADGKQIVLNVFESLDYFGEMSFFDKESRCATVITRKKSQFLVIPRTEFMEIMFAQPDIALNLIKVLLQKVRKATEQIKELAFMHVYERVARYLAETANHSKVIEKCPTQQEIGNMVGASRETVSRILKDLQRHGYIRKEGHRILLLQRFPYIFKS